MKRSYKKIITALKKLEEIWDDDLALIADNGSLMLVHYESKEVLENLIGIKCDGGASGTIIVDGKEYWDVDTKYSWNDE
jgi:hypothetical protein